MVRLICPALFPIGKEGDSLLYSYRSLTSGNKVIIRVPPGTGPHCNQETGEWVVQGPLTPNPDPPTPNAK